MSFNVDYIINLRDKASKKLGRLDKKAKTVNQSMTGLGGTFATVLSAGLIVGGISKSIKAFDRQEQAIAQVRTGLESTGNVAGKTVAELQKTAAQFQKDTIFGDEDILTGVTAQLLTFTNITGKQFDRTQQAALDVTSRLFGVDASAESLRSTSIQLGKALNDPSANMGALSRSGIQFSTQQKEVIKKLQSTGRLAEAQTIILDELQKQYGGSAEAAAAAGAGGLKQFQNQMGDIVEDIGGLLLPILTTMAAKFLQFIEFVKENAFAFKIIGGAILGLVSAVVLIIGAIKAWTIVQGILNFVLTANPIGIIIVAIGALIGAIVAVVSSTEGWGEQWDAILSFMAAKIEAFSFAFKFIWGGIKNFFKSMVDGIVLAWKFGMNLIGQLSDEQFEKDKKRIEEQKQLREAANLENAKGLLKAQAIVNKGVEFKLRAKGDKKDESALAGLGAAGGVSPLGAIPTGGGGAGKGLDSGIDKVTSSAPKVFNINIENLVKQFEITTNNMKEGAEQTKDMILQTLIGAVNDVSIIDK